MKKIICLLALLAVVSISPVASAENFTFGIGPIGNFFLVNGRPEMNPGGGGYLYFDYRWSPQISTQFSILVSTENGKGADAGDNGIEFLGIPTIDFKYYILSSESHWDPYFMAGIGLYAVSEGTQSNGTFGLGMGTNVGLGCAYYFTEKWSIGMGLSFRSIGLIDSGRGSNNAKAIFPLTLTANVGFHF